jgi:hypothetical protein
LSIFFQRSRASILWAEDLAFLGDFSYSDVAFLKGAAVEVVEVGDFVGAEEGPGAAGLHALHEEVGNPVGGVQVVGAAALVTGVHAELEEVLDVVVPDFEVGAAGARRLPPWLTATSWSLWSLRKGMTPWIRRWCL